MVKSEFIIGKYILYHDQNRRQLAVMVVTFWVHIFIHVVTGYLHDRSFLARSWNGKHHKHKS